MIFINSQINKLNAIYPYFNDWAFNNFATKIKSLLSRFKKEKEHYYGQFEQLNST